MAEFTGSELDIVGTEGGVRSDISNLANGRVTVFSTVKGDDFASKFFVAAALENAVPISDNLGKPIQLANIIAQPVEIVQENGVVDTVPRTVLIDTDGVAYSATSNGVFKAVEQLLGVIGQPHTWPYYPTIKVVAKQAKRGKFFTFELDREATAKTAAEVTKNAK